jgi:CBS domain-containing protein
MGTINEILRTKPKDIWSISSKASVFEGIELMSAKNIGALLVIDEGRLVGIFSERDYARKVILKGRTSKETTVGELMTKTVLYATPENTLEECMALMTSKHIHHLPILENDTLIGIVTLADVAKGIISEQEFTIRELENYYSGGFGA